MSKLDNIVDPIYEALEFDGAGYDSTNDRAKTKQEIIVLFTDLVNKQLHLDNVVKGSRVIDKDKLLEAIQKL